MMLALATLALAIFAACSSHTHEYVLDHIEEPDCWSDGCRVLKCKICGDLLYDDTVINRLGHNYKEVVEPSTCIKQGYKARKCTRCGLEEYHEPLPLADHTMQYEGENKAPTCTTGGWNTAGFCTVCKQTFPRTTVPALGHDWRKDGSCSRCGAEFSYSVRFHDEHNDIPLQSYKPGEHFVPPTPSNIPKDYHFEGWFSEDGTVRYDENTVIAEDLEVYAKWLVTHAVSNAAELAGSRTLPTNIII